MSTKMKQRSFYMDDETYSLIEAHATRLGTSNGTALRMLVRGALLDAGKNASSEARAEYERQLNEPYVEAPMERTVTAGPVTTIALPPDKQETFKVPERFKEKGPRVPKAVHSDDDF